MVKNKKQNIDGEIVNWNKIHWLLFKRSDPNIIWYKYRYEGEFKQIRICSDKGRQKQPELKSAYSQAQLISEVKYKDLNRLCEALVIPSRYHAYYKNLPYSGNMIDRLDETDISEPDNDDE